ncbi:MULTISPECIES: hypothetical protein [unclassified Mesorhizobium]|uniref:hypothetical protein n=1 Tax=Mesorhizobium TaxID=68287 RepID=UPI0003CEE9BB|nr:MULTISPECIES: hypothetical protein [unclassified Mesorhizobium]ESY91332.1 hypothetical protein X741_23865 [Mesorhizobium sp. LNHC229A00]ESY95910.1 hypothetical protein X738_20990 [Mesorhizobium sp. LNHC209A00]
MLKVLLIASAVLVNPARADDIIYKNLGAGLKTCGDFLRSKETTRTYYVSWILGFLTATNLTRAVAGGDGSMPKLGSPSDLELWMTNFCASHALETVANAAVNLSIEISK